jgi:very-short-patch-repair endonuclease
MVDVPPRPREVDCLWRSHRLVVELDGFATHATRRAFEDDRARDRALQTAGYRVLRITWRQLATDAHTIVRQLRTLLA